MSTDNWHCGKLARVTRSSDAVELQCATGAQGELTYFRLSLWETFGGSAPLKDLQNLEAHAATAVLASRGVYDALACSETSKFGLKDKCSGLEALALNGHWLKLAVDWAGHIQRHNLPTA